ncbi:hypothetical protein MMC29_006789 [Sticta canariensis]|nr:hypothetical protein [Sticta canariensis]
MDSEAVDRKRNGSSTEWKDEADGDDSTAAGTQQINFNEEFDIYLNEIEPLSKNKKDRTTISSRLIPFETLQKRASEDGFTLRSLPLSKLRSG